MHHRSELYAEPHRFDKPMKSIDHDDRILLDDYNGGFGATQSEWYNNRTPAQKSEKQAKQRETDKNMTPAQRDKKSIYDSVRYKKKQATQEEDELKVELDRTKTMRLATK
jgi:hypothetical protein